MPGWKDSEDPRLPGIGELTGRPADPDAAVAEVRHALGMDSARRERYSGEDRPGTSELREELGL